MKRLKLIGAVFFITTCFMLGARPSYAQKSDEAAIKKVINKETSDFFHKNYEAWATNWIHDTTVSIYNVSPSGFGHLSGWNNVSTTYKLIIEQLPIHTDEEIVPLLKKTDYQIFVNGNMATASFKEGEVNQKTGWRTLVKQNGTWKILSLTTVFNEEYGVKRIMDNMRVFVGKWVWDGTTTSEPDNGRVMNAAEFVLWETPTGLEQTSKFINTSSKGVSNIPPTDYEYFIPDYSEGKVFYLSVQKSHSGRTYIETGSITSNKMNSFTVTVTYKNKPNVVKSEYTVSLENGKWHQVGKEYDIKGKLINTSSMDMKRL